MKNKIALSFFIFINLNANAQINPNAIKIARDKWGVPHIFAKTDAEVAYGLAWSHAEDDFKTIQLTLLAGKRMLGRHLGKKGAAADYVVALIKAQEQANEKYNTDLSTAFKAVHAGYVAGINAYAAANPEEVLVKEAFPITPKEALAGAIFSISVFSGLDGAIKKILAQEVPLAEFKTEGSNAWAINSSKTKDGKVYLNINSHQPLEGPQSWYEAHVNSEEGWNCLGGLFPGGPCIFLGANENLGWSHTVNYHDKMDVYQLELNPADKNQYRFDNEWLTLEEREIKLPIKVGLFTVKAKRKAWWSKYGPTLITKSGQAFAIRYAALFDIRATEEWYWMNKAKNFSEFKKAMEMTAIPGFNTIYADKNDTIFYVSNGKIPFRNKDYNWQKTLPGNTSKTLWNSFHPFSDLPQLLNPKAGFVFNTNNTPWSATEPSENLDSTKYDKTMGVEWWENNRSIRFLELMKTYDKLDYDDFKNVKFDKTYPKKLTFFANTDSMYTLKSAEYPDISDVIEKIQKWDKNTAASNKDAAVFHLYYQYLKEKNKKNPYKIYNIPHTEMVEAFRWVKAHLLKNFKTIEVALGDVQKHVRGNVELPIFGIPDVLAAIGSAPYKDGKYKAVAGESYIELVKFSKTGLPEIESIIPYGASNHADSPHFTDQMEMYSKQQLKKMTLDKAEILRGAERIYSPK